jgi:RimJ/RimL family protein N-acetyltransferase
VVGDISTHHCSPVNGVLSYGVAIRADQRRNGYAGEAIQLVLRYYFCERRYQKANVSVYAFNEASIALHRRLGFQEEGRLRRTIFSNGRYWDELLFGITVEELTAQKR